MPHRPAAVQVSSIWTSSGAKRAIRSWGRRRRALDAVAVEHVGVLAAAGEAPPARHPVPAVGRGDRPGRGEHARDDDVAAGRRPCRTSRGAARRGRSTRCRRSSPSRPPRRRRGRAPRGTAARRQVGAEAAVAVRHRHPEAAGGARARRAGRRAAGGPPRPRRRGRRSSGPARGPRRAPSTSAVTCRSIARRRLAPAVRRSIGRLDGVPGAQRRVPAAVAVADDLGDPAVAHLAEPQPPGHLAVRWVSSCSMTKPVAVGTTRSSRARDRPAASRELPAKASGPLSWNRQNGGRRSKNTSGAKTSSPASRVSKHPLNAVASAPSVRATLGRTVLLGCRAPSVEAAGPAGIARATISAAAWSRHPATRARGEFRPGRARRRRRWRRRARTGRPWRTCSARAGPRCAR